MNAADRIAQERLAVLHLAERLGNAAEACRRSGVDRTSFYEWKRRFAREGIAGLRNRPAVHRFHPHTTPADVSRRIVAFALANPAGGCDRIATALVSRGVEISAVTIQKILHKSGLGTSESRGAALEAQYARGKRLSAVQTAFLEDVNPSFRERSIVNARPGELLCQGTFFLGKFEGVGPVYTHALVDAFSSYAFGVLATNLRVENTIFVLTGSALPFFTKKRIRVKVVLTSRLSETSKHMLCEHLLAKSIENRSSKTGRINGHVERFRRIALSEFLRTPFLHRFSRVGLGRLQREFDDWLVSYNETRPHDGYPNYGAPPRERIIQNGKCSLRSEG
jgi:transposase InsO family protein